MLYDLRSSNSLVGSFGYQGGDVRGPVRGLSRTSAGAGELPPMNEKTHATEGDAEGARGLVGCEMAGTDGLVLHDDHDALVAGIVP